MNSHGQGRRIDRLGLDRLCDLDGTQGVSDGGLSSEAGNGNDVARFGP